MKKDWKKKWLKALRNGTYKQGQDFLNHDGTYCCLGVIGDLAVKEGLARWISNKSNLGKSFQCIHSRNAQHGLLPEYSAIDLFGIKVEEQRTLALMNDKGDSFEEIADYIEANL